MRVPTRERPSGPAREPGGRRRRCGLGSRLFLDAHREQVVLREPVHLRARVVERPRRQARPHLFAGRRLQIVDQHDAAVRLLRGGQGQGSVVRETADEGLFLQGVAEDAAGHAAQHRDAAVVVADVVVAADHRPAHGRTRDEQPEHHDRDERPPHPAASARGLGILLRDDTLGRGARRTHRGGAARGGVRRRGVLVVPRRGAGDDRMALAVVEIDDVGDDDGDVVGAAAAQGEFDEPIGALVVRAFAHGVGDGLVADDVGQAVGADEVAVAGACLAHGEGRFDLAAGEGTHDERALWVAVRLLGRDAPLVDEGLHEGVVAGDLGQLAVAQQVGARIADVGEAEFAAGEEDGGERGAHAVEFGFLLDLIRDGGVALAHGGGELAEQVPAGFVVVEVGERRDHQLRGDFSGGVTAHAVGEGEQAGPRVHGIFVVGTNQATVAPGGVSQYKGHGRSLITVFPTRTGVPRGTRTAVVTLARSRYVPLVEPRSSTYQSDPRGDRRACRVEA